MSLPETVSGFGKSSEVNDGRQRSDSKEEWTQWTSLSGHHFKATEVFSCFVEGVEVKSAFSSHQKTKGQIFKLQRKEKWGKSQILVKMTAFFREL